MEILLLMLQTIPATIAILQLQIVILVLILANVIIIFFLNKLTLIFLIGLSCGNAKYLKNDLS